MPIVTEVACGVRDKLIVNGNDYNTHDGTCIRDYIHVQDLAIAHVKALNFLLENKVKDVFNVGTGKGLSVLDIINSFEEANCELFTLGDYNTLIDQALDTKYITNSDVEMLKEWREDPSKWNRWV